MRLIPLTQGKFAVVDDVDFDRFGGLRWCAHRRARTFYAVRRAGKKILFLHREIMGVSGSDKIVDHINHDGLDCARLNLRIVTAQQNSMNRAGPTRVSKSGIRGVSWDRIQRKWMARIKINGKPKTLGAFTNKYIAGEIAREARAIHYGEFAGRS